MLSPTFCWSHQPPHCAMSPVMAEDFCQDGRPGSSTAHNVAKPKLLSTNKDEVFTCLSEQSVFRIILLNIHIFSLSLNFQLGVLGPKASAQHCHPSFSTSGCSRYSTCIPLVWWSMVQRTQTTQKLKAIPPPQTMSYMTHDKGNL